MLLGVHVNELTERYRCAPSIANWPSAGFYNNSITLPPHRNQNKRTYIWFRSLHKYFNSGFETQKIYPRLVVHLENSISQKASGGTTLVNEGHENVIQKIVMDFLANDVLMSLVERCSSGDFLTDAIL